MLKHYNRLTKKLKSYIKMFSKVNPHSELEWIFFLETGSECGGRIPSTYFSK